MTTDPNSSLGAYLLVPIKRFSLALPLLVRGSPPRAGVAPGTVVIMFIITKGCYPR